MSFKSIDYLNSDDTLTSKQQDALEACHFCEGPILGDFQISDYDILFSNEGTQKHFCSERCVEKYDDNQAEAAYEHATSAVAQ